MKTIIRVMQLVILSFFFISFSFAADASMEEKWQNDFENVKTLVGNTVSNLQNALPEEFDNDFARIKDTLATISYDQDDLLLADMYDFIMHLGQYRKGIHDSSERSVINNIIREAASCYNEI